MPPPLPQERPGSPEGPSSLSPRQFLEALRAGDAARSRVGYEQLQKIFRLLHHPSVHHARNDASGQALADLIQGFLAHLLEPQGAGVRLELLWSWTGVSREAARWVQKQRRQDPSIERQAGLLRELLFSKLRETVRNDPAFLLVRGGCSLRHASPSGPLEDEDILAQLPPLPLLQWSPRPDQAPEVVGRPLLAAQLRLILTLGGNQPRALQELLAIVWRSLTPTPQEFIARTPPPDSSPTPWELDDQGPSPLDQVLQAEWEAHIDHEAHALLASLPARVLRSMHLRQGPPPRTLEEVAALLRIGKSTVDDHCKRFHQGAELRIQQQELDRTQGQQLIRRALEMIASGDFPLSGEDPSP